MNERFSNVYEDSVRADAYSRLDFPGTYNLAFRDLPAIIGEHVSGTRALDFGCGAGRSTRFLERLGFDASGVDIAPHMLDRARAIDPAGDYRLVADGDLSSIAPDSCDLVLCAFTFDNVATMEKKVAILSSLRRILRSGGRIVNLVSSPDIYLNEWASFSTKDFPENRNARSGDTVKIVMLDVDDARPVEDILWTHDAWIDAYHRSALTPIATYRPLGDPSEPIAWVSESRINPWVIYVLEPDSR
jgi:SAM-dependent methyltransferase